MRITLFILAVLLAIVARGQTQQNHFTTNKVSSGTGLTNVFTGTNALGARIYQLRMDVAAGSTNMLAEVKAKTFNAKLSSGEHVVYVTAVSTDGIESEPSNAVTVWVPSAVKNVAVVITGN